MRTYGRTIWPSGEEIGRVELPSNAYGAPMSYTAGGRQYVVVPLGNRLSRSGRPPELVALAIPHEGEKLPPPRPRPGRCRPTKPFTRPCEAMDAGDSETLRKLLARVPRASDGARLFPTNTTNTRTFAGATLLHHLAGETQRVPLPENAVELAEVLISAGADPNAATYDSITVLDMFIESDQLEWAESKPEMIQLLATNGVDVNRNRGSNVMGRAERGGLRPGAHCWSPRGADVDLRFAAGVNRVDLMAEFFDSEGQLKEGGRPTFTIPTRTPCSPPNRLWWKRSIMRPIAARWKRRNFCWIAARTSTGMPVGLHPLHRTVLADPARDSPVALGAGC